MKDKLPQDEFDRLFDKSIRDKFQDWEMPFMGSEWEKYAQKSQMKSFDESISAKLKQVEMPFEPQDWQKFEKHLDKEKRRRPLGLFWLFRGLELGAVGLAGWALVGLLGAGEQGLGVREQGLGSAEREGTLLALENLALNPNHPNATPNFSNPNAILQPNTTHSQPNLSNPNAGAENTVQNVPAKVANSGVNSPNAQNSTENKPAQGAQKTGKTLGYPTEVENLAKGVKNPYIVAKNTRSNRRKSDKNAQKMGGSSSDNSAANPLKNNVLANTDKAENNLVHNTNQNTQNTGQNTSNIDNQNPNNTLVLVDMNAENGGFKQHGMVQAVSLTPQPVQPNPPLPKTDPSTGVSLEKSKFKHPYICKKQFGMVAGSEFQSADALDGKAMGGLSLGGLVETEFSRRLGMGIGLQYSNRRFQIENTKMVETGDLSAPVPVIEKRKTTLHLIHMPVQANIVLYRTEQWRVYTSAGLTLSVAMGKSYKGTLSARSSQAAGGVSVSAGINRDEYASVGFAGFLSAHIGVGVERQLSDQWALFAQPAFQYGLVGVGAQTSLPKTAVISMGLKKTFK